MYAHDSNPCPPNSWYNCTEASRITIVKAPEWSNLRLCLEAIKYFYGVSTRAPLATMIALFGFKPCINTKTQPSPRTPSNLILWLVMGSIQLYAKFLAPVIEMDQEQPSSYEFLFTLSSSIHFMKKPTSLAMAPGTPIFCARIGSQPLALLIVAIVHSISSSSVSTQRSMLVYVLPGTIRKQALSSVDPHALRTPKQDSCALDGCPLLADCGHCYRTLPGEI